MSRARHDAGRGDLLADDLSDGVKRGMSAKARVSHAPPAMSRNEERPAQVSSKVLGWGL
jgi:hypothetical protein